MTTNNNKMTKNTKTKNVEKYQEITKQHSSKNDHNGSHRKINLLKRYNNYKLNMIRLN